MRPRCPTCYRPVDDLHRSLGRCPLGRAIAAGVVTTRRRPGYVPPSRVGRQPRVDYLASVRAPCGTRQAYKRHLANGEKTDPACRAANAAYVQTRAHAGR